MSDDHRCPSCSDHEDVVRLFLNPNDPVQRAWLYDQFARGKYWANQYTRDRIRKAVRETA